MFKVMEYSFLKTNMQNTFWPFLFFCFIILLTFYYCCNLWCWWNRLHINQEMLLSFIAEWCHILNETNQQLFLTTCIISSCCCTCDTCYFFFLCFQGSHIFILELPGISFVLWTPLMILVSCITHARSFRMLCFKGISFFIKSFGR